MIQLYGTIINPLDIIAPFWFLILGFSYSFFADYCGQRNLVNTMHKHRINWIIKSLKRDDRLVDIRIIESLITTTTFLASTSILIIGGLVAVLGYGKQAQPLISQIPFANETTLLMWIIKTTLLLIIFIHSFFKFTWVIRQFNYSLILIVSADKYKDQNKESTASVDRIATLISNSARHFNMGVRSYYFGLVALSWYINPIIFILLSILVVWVLYRREFLSKTLAVLE